VKYLRQQNSPEIPAEWLPLVTRGVRRALEVASELESELGGFNLVRIPPIEPDGETPGIDSYERTHGLGGTTIFYSSLVKQLISDSPDLAISEIQAWPKSDDHIFARLRIWALRFRQVSKASEVAQTIESIGNKAFWDARHQRDLLISIRERWSDLQQFEQARIEARLLNGPAPYPGEASEEHAQRQAATTLNRIHWLVQAGCEFSFDLALETEARRKVDPSWKLEFAAKADRSLEMRGGVVEHDTTFTTLDDTPIDRVLTKAKEISGRTADFLVERDPFSGLCREKPIRALAALRHESGEERYPEWAWRRFLNACRDRPSETRLQLLVGAWLCRIPIDATTDLVAPASDWFKVCGSKIQERDQSCFESIFDHLLQALRTSPATDHSGRSRDWVFNALNSPGGFLAEAVISSTKLESPVAETKKLLEMAARLLALGGDHARHASVLFSHHLDWFDAIDADWTEKHLLVRLASGTGSDRDAMMGGFLWRAAVPRREIFQKIKSALVDYGSSDDARRRDNAEVLVGMMLAGWVSFEHDKNDRLISNNEMTNFLYTGSENLRSAAVRLLKRWSSEATDVGKKWLEALPVFFRDVWPKQRSAKTAGISGDLFDLVFSNDQSFGELVRAVKPYLTKMNKNTHLHSLHGRANDLVAKHPRESLEIFSLVLQDDPATWPYGMSELVQTLFEFGESLQSDGRFVALRQNLGSR